MPVVSRRAFLSLMGASAAAVGLTGRLGSTPAAWATTEGGETSPTAPFRTRTNAERRQVQPEAVFEVPEAHGMVGLSFDDGPDPAYTPVVLRMLAAHRARATFFMVGINALAHRDLVADVVRAGHSIANHTFDHRELDLLSERGIQTEIDTAENALISVGAPKPSLFRPPKGFTDDVVRVEAHRSRYRTVFWTLCLEHFVDPLGVEAGVSAMLERVRPGAILLAHDGGHISGSGHVPVDRRLTMEALPGLLDGLAAMGLRLVDIPTLLSHGRSRPPAAFRGP